MDKDYPNLSKATDAERDIHFNKEVNHVKQPRTDRGTAPKRL